MSIMMKSPAQSCLDWHAIFLHARFLVIVETPRGWVYSIFWLTCHLVDIAAFNFVEARLSEEWNVVLLDTQALHVVVKLFYPSFEIIYAALYSPTSRQHWHDEDDTGAILYTSPCEQQQVVCNVWNCNIVGQVVCSTVNNYNVMFCCMEQNISWMQFFSIKSGTSYEMNVWITLANVSWLLWRHGVRPDPLGTSFNERMTHNNCRGTSHCRFQYVLSTQTSGCETGKSQKLI